MIKLNQCKNVCLDLQNAPDIPKTNELLDKRTSGGCNIQPCSYLHLTRHLYFKCSIISSLVELCFEGPKGCQQAVSISLSLSIEVSLSFNPVLILNSIPYNKVNIPFFIPKVIVCFILNKVNRHLSRPSSPWKGCTL